MSGGDLFDRIGKNKKYNEENAWSLWWLRVYDYTVSFTMFLLTKHPLILTWQFYINQAHGDMKPKNSLLVDD